MMDLYIDRDQLILGLSRVQGIVERRPTTAVLSHVLLSAQGQSLRMSATDTTLTLVADYVARVESEGEISVDAQNLFAIARSLPGPTVHLVAEAGGRLAVTCDRAEFHLVGLAASEFPPLPARDDRSTLGVRSLDLLRLIEETVFSVSADDNRYGLNGAHLEEVTTDAGDARVRVVTTDGSRLSWSEAPYEGEFGMGRRMLLPRKALVELRKLVEADESRWEIAFGERSATFVTEGLHLVVRLVEGEFPDYRKVIPPIWKRRVELSREPLTDALRRVAIVATDRNHSVRFGFEPDALVVEAHNVDLGDAREEVPCELDGPAMKTGFNVRYFADLLSATRSDRIFLEMGEPLDACIVRIGDRDDCLFVVMPMRLD